MVQHGETAFTTKTRNLKEPKLRRTLHELYWKLDKGLVMQNLALKPKWSFWFITASVFFQSQSLHTPSEISKEVRKQI